MTSDSSQNGQRSGRPSGRAARRVDEGDLWADAPTAPSEASPPAPAPPPRPAETVALPDTGSAAARPARAARPAAQRPLPAPEPEDAYPYDDEEDVYYDEEPSLLSNPYVLAAVVVLGAIMLAVIVVLFFGRNDDDTRSPGTTANATRTATPTVEGEDTPNVRGLAARSIAIATVREGPALSHLELGLLQADQDVDVVGRNEEATWFQIVFPPGTQLTGWVPETALRLPDNVTSLVDVAEPTQVARPEVPTATTAPAVEDTPTPAGQSGADLAVFISSDCTPGSEISIVVSNAGDVELSGAPIQVVVSNDGVVQLQQAFQADMESGASASLDTGVAARPPQMAVSVLLTELDDVNPSNNIASCPVEGSTRDNDNDGGNRRDNSGGNVPPPVSTQGN